MKDRKRPELTGRMLKLIALFFMILDHCAVVMLERGILQHQNSLFLPCVLTASDQWWQRADRLLRCVGRLSFPIFAFLCVEGFVHTRNKKAYGLRLFIFALLSEIPFDLAIFGKVIYPGYQNVMFTLLIAFLTLCAFRRFWYCHILWVVFLFVGGSLAELLRTDYGAMGVGFILLLYLSRESGIQLKVAAVMSALESLSCYGMGAASILFLRCYHGREGKWPEKYLFYFAYPGHLLILALMHTAIFS